jgi:hypothetical protein
MRRQCLAERFLDVPGQDLKLGHIVIDHEDRELRDLIRSCTERIEGLDQSSQEALAAYLRRRQVNAQPLFAMTRSSILDLDSMTSNETIIFCPANHSPPIVVAPYPGAPGYEAVAMCLAPPEVRARTEGSLRGGLRCEFDVCLALARSGQESASMARRLLLLAAQI